MSRARGGEKGFTLVEVFIALSVFAVGVLVLAMIIPLGIKKSNKASQQSRASQLCTVRAEQLLDAEYGEDDLNPGTHYDAGNPIAAQYYVEWVVQADTPIKSCKHVTINVRRGAIDAPVEAKVVVLKSEAEL